MDLHVCYWNDNENKVSNISVLSSLGKVSAQDMLNSLDICLIPLDAEKLIQVSSDEPNVNLAFLKLLAVKRKDYELDPLIDIGICRLYTLHQSFHHGASLCDSNVKKIPVAMHKIFLESPFGYECLMPSLLIILYNFLPICGSKMLVLPKKLKYLTKSNRGCEILIKST